MRQNLTQWTFLVSLVVLLLTGLLTSSALHSLEQSVDWVSHTKDVVRELDAFEALLKDAEIAQRGFVLTGEDVFLARYREAAAQLPLQANRLAQIVSDNRTQVVRAQRLGELGLQRLRQLEVPIALLQAGRTDRASAPIRASAGAGLESGLTGLGKEFRTEEEALLTSRQQRVQGASFSAYAAASINAALAMGLVALLRRVSELDAQRIRESEQEFRTTFEMAGVAKAQCEPESQRFLRVNQKMCELTGYSESELLVRTFMDLSHPEDRASDLAGFRQALRDKQGAYERDKRLVTKDGRTLVVLATTTVIRDAGGVPLRTLEVMQDLTARRAAEEEVRRLNDTLEERIRERTAQLEAFTYTVSHDLRAPLRGMQGFARALQEDYGDRLDRTARHYIDRIESAGGRMEVLI
jgi:PAS domain S-box-containing protein